MTNTIYTYKLNIYDVWHINHCRLFNTKSYIYIYIYIITVLVVTKSLCGFLANQVQYNLESAQYLL